MPSRKLFTTIGLGALALVALIALSARAQQPA